MDKEVIINHLKDLVKNAERNLKTYEKVGNDYMVNYHDGVKDGLQTAIEWLELQEN